ncbi:Myelin expression factor 2 [Galemys pyrenaicus]|uniref:Myelin expression factor 2 n=1 Tax=Galemys pyrenaicus TaxID=202257 RepID=A0A8J6DE72_GALPY|nr:Myelin expression factor 2 [Galemys pyrenaicus]
MADADKPEMAGAAGDDSQHPQPAEPPGEPRREPHPPEPEKQPPQHSSSSNGVKMYCLLLREPGRGGGRPVGLGVRDRTGPGSGVAARSRGQPEEQVQPGRSRPCPARRGPGARCSSRISCPRPRVAPSALTWAGEPLRKALRAPRENDESVKEEKSELKEKSTGNKKTNRFHPYSKDKNSGTGEKKGPNRNRVFISNIPYDMKWQAIKDLMREKVGEVTYVELFKDAEGKSRDPDGENARRALQRTGGSFPGGHVPDMASGLMNLPPSILNNPNIPPEVISNLQAGRLGSTIFVANLDFKVGWKKLKEVFSIAGTVKRADIKEDKDGKSRGMGTVTFEQAIEAVQAICILINTLALFNKDDKSVPHEDYRSHDSKTPQLPRGLGGIGMGLGPGGQPISASQLNIGGVMGNLGPSGMGVDGPSFGGMNRIGGGIGFGGLEAMNSMGGFGGVGRMGELYRGAMTSSMERDFGRGDIGINRGFGDSFGRLGSAMIGGFTGRIGASNMGPVGSGISGGMGGMNSVTGGMGMGLDRMSSSFDRMGPGIGAILERSIDMDRGFLSGPMGSGIRDRIGSKGNQIFVRNLPFDLTWQKLKEKFSQCGKYADDSRYVDVNYGGKIDFKLLNTLFRLLPVQMFIASLPDGTCFTELEILYSFTGHVMFAEIKMENGKSKGCGTVRFDSPESAEKACRIMNGIKISGREIDVRLDRNA